MDLSRMLEKCHRDQWSVEDLDWSREPRDLSADDELAIVQYFTDMAGIERLAGALFEEQRRRTEDPVLKEIFRTFVVDEVRHSHAAKMLADFYDRRKLKRYRQTPALSSFAPHFLHAIRHLSPAVANAYITSGEMILDIALLRSIDDYVDDDMSKEAMALINRDESRHIAIDFHMTEYYCSREYQKSIADLPRKTFAEQTQAWASFTQMLYYARPFFMKVFFDPMERVDPTNKRLLEAFKRIQLLGTKEEVARTPFVRFMKANQDLYNHPMVGRFFGPILIRILGSDPRVTVQLFNEEEERRAQSMSFAQLADDALDAKTLH